MGLKAMPMNSYSPDALVRIARRENNKKRSYLFVNPLQAKHIPVSPTESLSMMRELATVIGIGAGKNVVVIGFAETATAIGAVVAASIGENVRYIHTTREKLPGDSTTLGFLEEHSHAADQALCSSSLGKFMCDADELVFVDDEYSTGRTFLNAISVLSENNLLENAPRITALSVINRIDEKRVFELSARGVNIKYLLRFDPAAYIDMFDGVATLSAKRPPSRGLAPNELDFAGHLDDPRIGVDAKEYWDACTCFACEVVVALPDSWRHAQASMLVLGTEECMAPALALGSELESSCPWLEVKCHATTRSPISISVEQGYPIHNGMRLRSLYDRNRETFIYNLQAYDYAIVVTDAAKSTRGPGIEDISSALLEYGCHEILVVTLR